MGRVSWSTVGVAVCDFLRSPNMVVCEGGGICMRFLRKCMWNLWISKSFLPDDTELPDLIIDELSDSMALYYRKLKSMGRNICGGVS